eukprot:TRINITY_DN5598_c0_g2_i1.p1 TRINITY_DN5598_c0_g2~~TRINITY_DN5598_c0_g2_i1.p1  ORF type:complete len:343 (-),score=20.19 TRINITY_DN5598_c0_g2_i1:87-1034(-)
MDGDEFVQNRLKRKFLEKVQVPVILADDQKEHICEPGPLSQIPCAEQEVQRKDKNYDVLITENIKEQIDSGNADRKSRERNVDQDLNSEQKESQSRRLRSRPPLKSLEPEDLLREHIDDKSYFIIFSGSGLSASAGMSMFSTQNGLYERARKKFKVTDGKRLFQYGFYDKGKQDVNQFYCAIYKETQAALPTLGHTAIKTLANQQCLRRHYTLNVDSLMDRLGVSHWHPIENVDGITVEVHGNLRELICPSCGNVTRANGSHIYNLSRGMDVCCKRCQKDNMRFKMMLYDDPDSNLITSEKIWDILEEDISIYTI